MSQGRRHASVRRFFLGIALAVALPAGADTAPNWLGQTGFIHMPDGRLAEDGTARAGISHMDPYTALWGSITLMPWLEISGRFTRIDGVQAFGGLTQFGANKDKAFDVKLRLLAESDWLPAVAVGRQDFHGTALFAANFIAASKAFHLGSLGALDLSIGYGDGRIDGWFGGLRWRTPWDPRFAIVAEYDGIDYARDYHAQQTGLMLRNGGLGLGLEFRSGWLGTQVAHQDGRWGINVSMSIPLQESTFVPKTGEPAPVDLGVPERHPLTTWVAHPASLQPLLAALTADGLHEVRIRVDQHKRLHVSLAHGRYTAIGRGIGRAARIVAAYAPPETNGLTITFTEYRIPLATWTFEDVEALRGYFTERVSASTLAPTVSVSYVDAEAYAQLRDEGFGRADIVGPGTGEHIITVGSPRTGFPVLMYRNHYQSGTFRLQPVHASLSFNDPNGAFKWELFSMGTWSRWLGSSTYVTVAGRFTLWENVSDTIGASNSLLPRVRSDVARYRREGNRLKLHAAYIGHLGNPVDRVYTWLSAGIYEEMFAGAGGEVMYLPETGNWAVDFSAYGVRQRDYKGGLGFFDYETVQALGAFHYRFPGSGVTVTTRAGRFLAGDHGGRVEVRRRFRSGFEVGVWYSHTDAKDITSPGSPGNPYRDKGVFLRFALGPFMDRDHDASTTIALSPWARDPGQMLQVPGGLYRMFERRLMLNLEDRDLWTDFGQ